MLFQQVRRGFGLLLLCGGLILYAWGVWPAMNTSSNLTILPREMQLLGLGDDLTQVSAPAAVPAVLEVRRLSLEAPVLLRVGDQGIVKLTFAPDTDTLRTGETGGLEDVFDNHLVVMEARLEIGGLEVRPTGTLSRPLEPAQAASFEWQLFPQQAGVYEGTAWFYLRFMTKDGSSGNSQPISAQRLEIRPSSWIGLTGPQARLAGGVGVLAGLFLTGKELLRLIRYRCNLIHQKLL